MFQTLFILFDSKCLIKKKRINLLETMSKVLNLKQDLIYSLHPVHLSIAHANEINEILHIVNALIRNWILQFIFEMSNGLETDFPKFSFLRFIGMSSSTDNTCKRTYWRVLGDRSLCSPYIIKHSVAAHPFSTSQSFAYYVMVQQVDHEGDCT